MLNPYLFYQDTCEAAFNFYAKVLGGKIEMMLRASEGPPDMQPSPGREKMIMHARMSLPGGSVLMASDAPPDHFNKPQGFSISLTVADPAEGERKFNALGRRRRHHAFHQDLLGQGLWHVCRQVRHSLDGELPGRRNAIAGLKC